MPDAAAVEGDRLNMTARMRSVTFLALTALALVAYQARLRHEMIDFVTWRQAVVRALHAEPLYRPEDGHYQFKYFPLFALAMAPFGLVDRETGKLLWFGVLVGLLVAMLRWSITALPERRLPQRVLMWAAIVLMAKFFAHELLLGQTNLLIGALLLSALVAVQRGQRAAAGAFVGLAVFVKPYALILAPWLLVTQAWPAAVMTALIVVAGLLMPAAVYGWGGNVDLLRGWLRTVSDSTMPNLLNNDNVSIASMWAKWLGPGSLASGLAWLTMGATLILVVVVWRQRRAVPAPEYLECALLMLLIPLLSPQGWDYVLLLATPAVVCLVDRWREFSRPWQGAVGVALALMCLTMFDIMGRALYGRFMSLSVVTVAALAVAVGLAHVRWRRLA